MPQKLSASLSVNVILVIRSTIAYHYCTSAVYDRRYSTVHHAPPTSQYLNGPYKLQASSSQNRDPCQHAINIIITPTWSNSMLFNTLLMQSPTYRTSLLRGSLPPIYTIIPSQPHTLNTPGFPTHLKGPQRMLASR